LIFIALASFIIIVIDYLLPVILEAKFSVAVQKNAGAYFVAVYGILSDLEDVPFFLP